MAALSRTAKAIGSPPRDDSAGHDVSRRGQFKLPVPVHSTACGKGKREVQEPSARVGRATMSIGSSKPLPSHHSFVRPPRSHSSVPAALSKTPARAAPRQGWRVSATARLVLDGRESDGMLMRHGATQVANATPQSPRGHSHQTPFPCSPIRAEMQSAAGVPACWRSSTESIDRLVIASAGVGRPSYPVRGRSRKISGVRFRAASGKGHQTNVRSKPDRREAVEPFSPLDEMADVHSVDW
jgi:hypothetical protein